MKRLCRMKWSREIFRILLQICCLSLSRSIDLKAVKKARQKKCDEIIINALPKWVSVRIIFDLWWSSEADSANFQKFAMKRRTKCITEIGITQLSRRVPQRALCESHWQWYGNDAFVTHTHTRANQIVRVHIVVRCFHFIFIFCSLSLARNFLWPSFGM